MTRRDAISIASAATVVVLGVAAVYFTFRAAQDVGAARRTLYDDDARGPLRRNADGDVLVSNSFELMAAMDSLAKSGGGTVVMEWLDTPNTDTLDVP